MLLASAGFIPLLVDSLLLDLDHPRMKNAAMQGVTDWAAAKGPVQRVRRSSHVRLHLTAASVLTPL